MLTMIYPILVTRFGLGLNRCTRVVRQLRAEVSPKHGDIPRPIWLFRLLITSQATRRKWRRKYSAVYGSWDGGTRASVSGGSLHERD